MQRRATGVILLLSLYLPLILLYGFASALAAETAPSFHHSDWLTNSLGTVVNIQQDTKGYLWLTTSTGIYRFDGVRFQRVHEVTNGAVNDEELTSSFVSASGSVWFVTRRARLLEWRDNRLKSYPRSRCTPATGIRTPGIVEDSDGALWMQAPSGLFRFDRTTCEEIGERRGYAGGMPAGLLADSQGTIWVKTWSGSLLQLPRGASRFQAVDAGSGATANFAYLHEAPDHSVWLSDDYGLRQVRREAPGADRVRPKGTPHRDAGRFQDFGFATDGSFWAATDKGIRWAMRAQPWQNVAAMEAAPGESFTPREGLSSDYVWKIFVDKEGTTWVGTSAGLDQFRRLALHALAVPATQQRQLAVAPGDNNSVWTGSRALPLTRVTGDGAFLRYRQTAQTICIRRDQSGTIWSSGAGRVSLWHTTRHGLEPVAYPNQQAQSAIAIAVDRDKNLWLNLRQFGVYKRTGADWSEQNEQLGKLPSNPGAMAADPQGNVWFAFSNQVVTWDGTQFVRFLSDKVVDIAPSTLSVQAGHVWIGGPGGVALFSGGSLRKLRFSDRDLPGRASGIVETNDGNLWISTLSGVTHVPREELDRWMRNPHYAVTAQHLDGQDGLPGQASEPLPEPSVVQSPGGRLWFATSKGLAWLDPAVMQRMRNQMPPAIDISSVIADGKSLAAEDGLQLGAHVKDLEINYTALSLVVPDRVFFRYKLDGVDKDWEEAGTRRQAFYTNLPPGQYSFHVRACNNDGVWNEAGASLGFYVAPHFYQTWWFRTLMAVAAFGVAWGLVQIRVHSLTHSLHERMAERVAERERIAADLHDTLLQSFFGLALRLQATADQLPKGDPLRASLDEALKRSDAAVLEGRARIQDLRLTEDQRASLHEALNTAGCQLTSITGIRFEMSMTGQPSPLDPSIQEEMFLIGREALTNAFKHSRAKHISADVKYDRNSVELCILDDGLGFDAASAGEGKRVGHWGLLTMRERARKIRADLTVQRRTNGGMQVHLYVPSSLAYREHRRSIRSLWTILPTFFVRRRPIEQR